MKEATKTGKRRWHWGDRSDGYKLRTVNPMTRMMPYIMPQRADACNYFADSIDVTKTDRFCREKVRAGMTNFGFLHILIASYLRAISQRPALNRFVSGQKIYARKGIQIVIKSAWRLIRRIPASRSTSSRTTPWTRCTKNSTVR